MAADLVYSDRAGSFTETPVGDRGVGQHFGGIPGDVRGQSDSVGRMPVAGVGRGQTVRLREAGSSSRMAV